MNRNTNKRHNAKVRASTDFRASKEDTIRAPPKHEQTAFIGNDVFDEFEPVLCVVSLTTNKY